MNKVTFSLLGGAILCLFLAAIQWFTVKKTEYDNLLLKADSLHFTLKQNDSLKTILKGIETSPDDSRKFKLILFNKVQQSYSDLDKIGKKIDGVGTVGLAMICLETTNEVYPELFNYPSTITDYSVTNGAQPIFNRR